MPEFQQQHGSGLYVPAETLDKTQKRLSPAEFGKLEQFMRRARREWNLLAVWHCETCKQQVRIIRRQQLVEKLGETTAPGGAIELSCACTTRTVR